MPEFTLTACITSTKGKVDFKVKFLELSVRCLFSSSIFYLASTLLYVFLVQVIININMIFFDVSLMPPPIFLVPKVLSRFLFCSVE